MGEEMIPDTVRWSFYIGGVVFILSILVTIFTTREYSPEEMKSFNAASESTVSSSGLAENKIVSKGKFSKLGLLFLLLGAVLSGTVYCFTFDKQIYILGGIFLTVAVLFFIANG